MSSLQDIVCGIAVFFAILAFPLGMVSGCSIASERFKKDAVIAGQAEYVPNKYGEPVWRMKEVGK